MMNALTWILIVLLLLVDRLVRLVERGVVFLSDKMFLLVDSAGRIAPARILTTNYGGPEKQGNYLDGLAWRFRDGWPVRVRWGRSQKLFANDYRLETQVARRNLNLRATVC